MCPRGEGDYTFPRARVSSLCVCVGLIYNMLCCALSCPTLCNPHGLQHARLPCPSPSPGVFKNSCPLSWWCHPTISSSVVPFSCLHSFPASGSFPMSQLFASGGQNISVSASVLPVNIQGWFPLGLTGLISLYPRDFPESLAPQFQSISSLVLSLLYDPALTLLKAPFVRRSHLTDFRLQALLASLRSSSLVFR